jgi:hypothetical protein
MTHRCTPPHAATILRLWSSNQKGKFFPRNLSRIANYFSALSSAHWEDYCRSDEVGTTLAAFL